MPEYFLDNKNWIASFDALSSDERKQWMLSKW
jgi:hypothetical protein